MNPVGLGDTVYPQFGTASPATGAATNADSTPTVTVEEDGVAMGYAPTVTNVAAGLYRYQLDVTGGNGFEAGKRYVVYVVATVGGVTGRAPIDEFQAITNDLDAVSSRVDVEISSVITHGDSAWSTATGFSTHSVADIWARVIEAGFTAEEILRLSAAVVQGDAIGLEGAAPVFKSIDGTKDRIIATYSAGTRTVTARDAS
jgi:hypothetical protein